VQSSAIHPRPKVLVVDDDHAFAGVVEAILMRMDFDVLVCSQARQAIKLIEAGGIRLVVSDLFMPDMDGLELVKALRRLPERPPVIALSGTDWECRDVLFKALRDFGASLVLSKPLDIAAFQVAVERLLSPGVWPDLPLNSNQAPMAG
jgi:DNA-binding response OmpR family regulator